MSKNQIVLMYSPDSIGLGHMRRNSAIAAQLVSQFPDYNVLLLVGSGAGAYFAMPQGVDAIKLPSIQKVMADKWVPRSLNLSTSITSQLRANLICETVRCLEPDLLLVDHLPLGVGNDLLPALDMIKRRGLATRPVLGLRDILDEPDVIRRRWTAENYYDAVNAYYDQVLIYGEHRIVPTADLYGFSERFPEKVDYCGYVCGSETLAEGESKLNSNRLAGTESLAPNERLVVVCGGGGYDAYPMMSASLAALRMLDDESSLRSIVIAGPLMAQEDWRRLKQAARGLRRTTLLREAKNCRNYFRSADIAVIMGGYNSFLEAASCCSSLIMIPRTGPSAEQRMRAALFTEKGVLRSIELHQATPERLAFEILQNAGAEGKNGGFKVRLNGARRAAQALARGSIENGGNHPCHAPAQPPQIRFTHKTEARDEFPVPLNDNTASAFLRGAIM